VRGPGGYIILKDSSSFAWSRAAWIGRREYWKNPSLAAPRTRVAENIPEAHPIAAQDPGRIPLSGSSAKAISFAKVVLPLLRQPYRLPNTSKSIGLSSPRFGIFLEECNDDRVA